MSALWDDVNELWDVMMSALWDDVNELWDEGLGNFFCRATVISLFPA